jgi:Flp pilus assembly protein TadD
VTRHRNWQWQDPLRLWIDATEKGPGNGRAWMNAGLQFMQRGDFVPARSYFDRARELAPNYAYVYINLSVLESHLGHLPEALRAAENAVRLKPDLSLSHYYHGRVLEKLGHVEEALTAYRHAVTLNPRDETAQKAVTALEDTVAWSVDTLMDAGKEARDRAGDPDRAITYFRRVLRKDPTNYAATHALATALDSAGMPDEARRVWETLLPLAQSNGDLATVQAARERLSRPDAPDDAVRMQRGVTALYTNRDPETAIGEFRTVLRHTPTHYGATYQLAAALDAAGKPDEARPLWEKVLAMADAIEDVTTAHTARRRLQQAQ